MHPLIDGWCRVGNVDGINDRGKTDLSWLRKNGEGHLVVAGEYTHRMATKAHTTVGMSQIEKSRAEITRSVGLVSLNLRSLFFCGSERYILCLSSGIEVI